MATNPMLQAVLRFSHNQTTTPFQPVQPAAVLRQTPAPAPAGEVPNPPQPVNPDYMPGAPQAMAVPKTDKPPFDPPLEGEEDEDEEQPEEEEDKENDNG